MKISLFSLFVGAGVLLTLSCSEMTSLPSGGDSVSFRVSGLTDTKATETTFEESDAVGIFASDEYGGLLSSYNYADNKLHKYSSGEFIPVASTEGITYPDEYTSLAFYAVYPYSNLYSGSKIDFSVETDQTSPDAYTISNLMVARTAATREEVVDLTFDHKLCKIIVNLQSENFPVGDRKCLFTDVYTDVEVDLNDGSVETVGRTTNVYGSSNGTNSFKVILPPQVIEANTRLILLQIGNEKFKWAPSKDLILLSGTEYEIDLTI